MFPFRRVTFCGATYFWVIAVAILAAVLAASTICPDDILRSAGIGENDYDVRRLAVEGLENLGIEKVDGVLIDSVVKESKITKNEGRKSNENIFKCKRNICKNRR